MDSEDEFVNCTVQKTIGNKSFECSSTQISPSVFDQLIAVILVILTGSGLLLTTTTFTMFAKHKHLQKRANVFVFNLAISDTLALLTVYPFCWLSYIQGRWLGGNWTCQWYGFAFLAFGLVSIYSMVAVAVERFYTIARVGPTGQFIRRHAFKVVLLIWTLGFSATCPPLYGWSRFYVGFDQLCYLTGNQPGELNVYPVLFLTIASIIPLCVMIICYFRIYRAVNRVTIRLRHSQENAPVRRITLPQRPLEKNLGLSSTGPEIRTEKEVARRLVFIILALLLCWLPYCIISSFNFRENSYMHPLRTFSLVLVKSSVVFNSLIYVVFNKKYQVTFLSVLCCWRRQNDPEANVGLQTNRRRCVSDVTSTQRSSSQSTSTFTVRPIHTVSEAGRDQSGKRVRSKSLQLLEVPKLKCLGNRPTRPTSGRRTGIMAAPEVGLAVTLNYSRDRGPCPVSCE